MIKKLLVWLLRDCPMLGQIIKISYNSVKTPKADRKVGYWVNAVRDSQLIDINEALVFTESEFNRIIDRLYVKNIVPELLPAGYGVPHTTKCIFEAGPTIREEDRIIIRARVNWACVYLIITDTEFKKARDRGRNCDRVPKLKWWHKFAIGLVNRFQSLRPEPRPYDWNKRVELKNKLVTIKSKKGL